MQCLTTSALLVRIAIQAHFMCIIAHFKLYSTLTLNCITGRIVKPYLSDIHGAPHVAVFHVEFYLAFRANNILPSYLFPGCWRGSARQVLHDGGRHPDRHQRQHHRGVGPLHHDLDRGPRDAPPPVRPLRREAQGLLHRDRRHDLRDLRVQHDLQLQCDIQLDAAFRIHDDLKDWSRMFNVSSES